MRNGRLFKKRPNKIYLTMPNENYRPKRRSFAESLKSFSLYGGRFLGGFE
jgi:hypothetical protein